ncbi:MAG: hypothetical protein JWL89_565 [Candidatus Saccharibacteria bacterium]|nr:hypothetical protein [Candidatus Saccharibacteria bacterium]
MSELDKRPEDMSIVAYARQLWEQDLNTHVHVDTALNDQRKELGISEPVKIVGSGNGNGISVFPGLTPLQAEVAMQALRDPKR